MNIPEQSINLYLPAFRKRKNSWALSLSILFVVAAILAIFSISFYQHVDNHKLAKKVMALESEEKAIAAQVNAIDNQSNPINGPALKTSIEEARAALNNRKNIADVIQGQDLGSDQGFHKGMMVLQEAMSSKVVLKAFAFKDGGKSLSMEGHAASSDLVPQFIQDLQLNPYFSDTRFGALSIQRSGSAVHFNLTGKPNE